MTGSPPPRLLADLRRALGLTQEQLAERAGLSVRVVGKLENGKINRPRPRTLIALSDALELSAEHEDALLRTFRLPSTVSRAARATKPNTPVLPRQLPGRPAPFHGRQRECAALIEYLVAPLVAGPAVISGFGGIGKSGLALECAAQLAAEFTDGQLFVQLTDPDGAARPADAVLAEFLRAVGVPGRDVPAGLAERSAAWRTATAGRRLLIVLDDAQYEDQVRPLLVGDRCRVVVTSRSTMGGLDAHVRIRLAPLTSAGSTQVLVGLAPTEMAGLDETTVARAVAICGGVPLALRLLGARLVLSAGSAAHQLVNSPDPAALLDCGDQSIATAIQSTIAQLRPVPRRMLVRVAQLDLPVVTDWLAAAATGLPMTKASVVLDELADAGLLDAAANATRRGFHLHDLVRAGARQQVPALQDEDVARAGAWMVHILAATVPRTVARPVPHVLWPERPVDLDAAFGDAGLTLGPDWFDVEYTNALALTSVASKRGLGELAAALVAALRQPMTRTGRLHALRVLAESCAGIDIPRSLAWACNQLTVAAVDAELGHLERARATLLAVLPHLEAADPCTLAGACQESGWLHARLGQHRTAARAYRRAARLHRSISNEYGEVGCCVGLAEVYTQLDDPRAARQAGLAREKARELTDPRVRIKVELSLSRIGASDSGADGLRAALRLALENDERSLAAQCHTALAASVLIASRVRMWHASRAVALARELGRPADLADALTQLGAAHADAGDAAAAECHWREAREIEVSLDQLDSPRRLPDLLAGSRQLGTEDTSEAS